MIHTGKKVVNKIVTKEVQVLDLIKNLISYFKHVQELKASMSIMPHQTINKGRLLKKTEILELKKYNN